MTASLIGVVSIWKKIGNIIEKNLHYLVSFSAGVFLIISYNLIIETIEHSDKIETAIFWIITGIFLLWITFKILPDFDCHDEVNCEKKHNLDPRKVILSDAIHNIGDGILLTTALSISSIFGALTALGIFVHEIIQELSEFFILKEAGYSTKKALKINFLVSGTILFGSISSFWLLEGFEILETPMVGLTAGAFLIVVLKDLIPHSVRHSISTKHFFKHILWFIIGIIVMFLISSNLSHH